MKLATSLVPSGRRFPMLRLLSALTPIMPHVCGRLCALAFFAACSPGIATPEVVWTDPVQGGAGVSQKANVQIIFSARMNFATVNSNNVTVVGSVSGAHDGVFSFDASATNAIFNPNKDFSAGEIVTVSISTNVSSQGAEALSSNMVFSFEVLPESSQTLFLGGTLMSNAVWTSGNVYVITNDLTVPSGRVLTIEAGTVVKMCYDSSASNKRRLIIGGNLQLKSTSTRKIIFTSDRDDQYGADSNVDGNTTSASPGDWGYIRYDNSANSFHDALIRYGGGRETETYMLWLAGKTATFDLADSILELSGDTTFYATASQKFQANRCVFGISPKGIVGGGSTVSECVFPYLNTAITLSSSSSVQSNRFIGCTWAVYCTGGSSVVMSNTVIECQNFCYQGALSNAFAGNIFVGNTNATLTVGGILSQDTTWGDLATSCIYVIDDDLTVAPGVKLTIAPGTVVKFGKKRASDSNEDIKLIVQGALWAQGQPGNEIYFTGIDDGTVGGAVGGDGVPASTDWGWIEFQNSSDDANCLMEYCIVRYGGNDWAWAYPGNWSANVDHFEKAAIRCFDASPMIRFCQITDCRMGISGSGASNPQIVSNLFLRIMASDYCLRFDGNGAPTILGNTLTNVVNGIRVDTGAGSVIANKSSMSGVFLECAGAATTSVGSNVVLAATIAIRANANQGLNLAKNMFAGTAARRMAISGSITTSSQWSSSSLTNGGLDPAFYLEGDVTVNDGASLTITPGTIVKFQYQSSSASKRRLYADGLLIAQGTASNPVIFTCDRDDGHGGDSNQDGTNTIGKAGDWGYVYVNEPGTVLENSQFWYGGQRSDGNYMLWVAGPNIFVRRCEFHYAYNTCVYANIGTAVTDPRIGISGCLFDYCPTGIDYTGAPTVNSVANFVGNYFSHGITGVYVRNVGTTLRANYNQFIGLTSYGIQNTNSSQTVDGQNNWWGNASGPSGQGAGSGVPVSEYVNYGSWLTTPSSQAQGIFNVFAQRVPNSMTVDIAYDLMGDVGTTYSVSVVVSSTGGEPYTITPVNGSLRGVVGPGISPGTGLHILWNAAMGSGPQYSDKMRVKIIADQE